MVVFEMFGIFGMFFNTYFYSASEANCGVVGYENFMEK
jgi:hypothetical protein